MVCCCCARKVKFSKKHGSISRVSERYAVLVRKHVWENFTVENPTYPTGLCDSCRLTLVAFEKVNLNIFQSRNI